jgi:hypothetical protein
LSIVLGIHKLYVSRAESATVIRCEWRNILLPPPDRNFLLVTGTAEYDPFPNIHLTKEAIPASET